MQAAANALRLGAYRTGVASSMPLLRCAAPRAFRLSAPAPRHAAAALPSGTRRYSQKQPGESKIWSFEDVRCALALPLPTPPIPGRNGDEAGGQALREEWKATRTTMQTEGHTDRLTSYHCRHTDPEAHARRETQRCSSRYGTNPSSSSPSGRRQTPSLPRILSTYTHRRERK